jgi:hypothetical protein
VGGGIVALADDFRNALFANVESKPINFHPVGTGDCRFSTFFRLEMDEGIWLAALTPLRKINALDSAKLTEDFTELGFRPFTRDVGNPDRLRDEH